MKKILVVPLVIIFIGLVSCGTPTIDEGAATEIYIAGQIDNDPCLQDQMNHVPPEYSRCYLLSGSGSSSNDSTTIELQCKDTKNLAGNWVTCTIQRAYCSYHPTVNGSPTFCNDSPYPSSSFALIVWGSDWSGYNGNCLVVSGLVTLYQGNPQIEATNRSQVSFCK